jgi:hypothetical protein
MQSLYKNKKYIDRYLVRDLSSSELDKFHDMIQKDPKLSSIVEDREIELIEHYLFDKLEGVLLVKFKERIRSDKEFEENVNFTRSLGLAAKDIKRRTELKNQLAEIKQKIDQEELKIASSPITEKKIEIAASPIYGEKSLTLNKEKNKILKLIIPISIAASLLLLFTVFNPFSDRKEISKYLASSGDIHQIDVTTLPSFIQGERNSDSIVGINIAGKQLISIINDERLNDKYFIKDKVLYTYIEPQTEFKVFTKITIEGQAEYYLCKGNIFVKFSNKSENKIILFEQVRDSTMWNYCQ